MQHLHAIGEDEMVAVFLQTEVASTRFASTILAILRRDGRARPTCRGRRISGGAPGGRSGSGP
jgi:hypothetical protein